MTFTPPVNEFRRGWGVVLASSIGVMCSCITLVNYSLGVFVVPLGEAFGWGRGQVLLATSLVSTGALVSSFFAGWLADRADVGRVIVASQIGFGLAFVALAVFGQSLTTFYAIYLAIAFVAGATLPITFTKIVAARFTRRRGLAIGLTLAGTGLAGFLVPPYAGYFVDAYGWRIGSVAVAALPLLLAMPLSYRFLRAPGAAAGAAPAASHGLSLAEALRTWRYWVLAVAFFAAAAAATGVSANIVPMMRDRGFSPHAAANLAGIYGLAVIAGRIIIGALADYIWAPPLAMVFLLPAAAATVLLATVPPDFVMAMGLLIGIGVATGAEGDLLSYLVARYFGVKAYGKIFAGIFASFIAAIAVSAPAFGYLFDTFKSYDVAMNISAAGWVLCGALFLTLGRYPSWDTGAGSSSS